MLLVSTALAGAIVAAFIVVFSVTVLVTVFLQPTTQSEIAITATEAWSSFILNPPNLSDSCIAELVLDAGEPDSFSDRIK